MQDRILHWIVEYGYFGIFSMLVLGIVGLPVPDEWLLALSGFLVYRHSLQLYPTIGAAFLGSACGITLSYGLGRTLGIYVIHRYGRYVHLTAERVQKTHDWFEHMGRWTLMLGYFVPGVRHLTAYIAGSAEMNFVEFAPFAYTGAFIWATTFVMFGYLLGDKWSEFEGHLHAAAWVGGLVVALAIFLVVAIPGAQSLEVLPALRR